MDEEGIIHTAMDYMNVSSAAPMWPLVKMKKLNEEVRDMVPKTWEEWEEKNRKLEEGCK